MALELRPGPWQEYGHTCPLPWPKDPEIPEGHACECGRRWVYQPARWDPLCTLEQLRLRQEAGDFMRGIVPSARSEPHHPQGYLATSSAEEREPARAGAAVIVPIPAARMAPPEKPPPAAS